MRKAHAAARVLQVAWLVASSFTAEEFPSADFRKRIVGDVVVAGNTLFSMWCCGSKDFGCDKCQHSQPLSEMERCKQLSAVNPAEVRSPGDPKPGTLRLLELNTMVFPSPE